MTDQVKWAEGRGVGNYDRFPVVSSPAPPTACVAGWPEVASRLGASVEVSAAGRRVLVVDSYVGVDVAEIRSALESVLGPDLVVDAAEAFLPEAEIETLVAPFLGGDDPLFGFLCGLDLRQFFDVGRLERLRRRVDAVEDGLVIIVGCGASLIHEGDVLVLADLARWEAQQRQRRNQVPNLGAQNQQARGSELYKRSYFVDWRVCDRWKSGLFGRIDFLLDTNEPGSPRLVEGGALRDTLAHTARRPFRLVPFFDPGPWGGHWMEEVCGLETEAPNHAWCFDCVPEENSLLLGFGDTTVEIPSLDLVLTEPRALLGEAVHARFGAEFPIRFDFLDTMGGGNLSLQVHPLTEYIQTQFGMHYTQDESYYILDATPDSSVYLGVKTGVDRDVLLEDLRSAQDGGVAFDADEHINRWPAQRHDHFLIPAGTIHCSGADTMVLEISSTPYIFTFKLWDWGRLGLDGLPRPINIDHGEAVIEWSRDTEWVKRELIDRVEVVANGDGWREERTGLHEREFIETRRHWFDGVAPHKRTDSVDVLNLVEGAEAIVESPDGSFEPFVVHYAETFVVPAAAGDYTIRPHGLAEGQECATIKASVRTGTEDR